MTDFQRLAKASSGELLPIFGRDLFTTTPSTFAPGDQIPVASDYLLGPGDEILLRIWGPQVFNGELTVDRSGSIYVPKVGAIHVAGLKYEDVKQQISTEIARVYRNFELSVNMGRLRSVQVYVVGEARHPGAYTLSSFSTVLNALFASGGPSAQGSLRRIVVRRSGAPDATFDLYDFLLHGDKSKDVRLENGDTIFIPPVGPQVALAGSVRHPAIYELSSSSTLDDVFALSGGLSPTASSSGVSLERIDANRTRFAMTVGLDASGRATPLRDGDVIFVNHISAAYENTVSIRGNLANPGRFAWHEGMKLSDIIPDKMSLLTTGYWEARNNLGVPAPLFTSAPEAGLHVSTDTATPAGRYDRTSQNPPIGNIKNNQDSAPPVPATLSTTGTPTPDPSESHIQVPAPEINWSYAVIERLDVNTLKSVLIPFNLGRLVDAHDASQNLDLRPGDVVTILSQKDLLVSRDQQTKYVRLEGEFAASGVYSVAPGETLADVTRRAGGLTSKAYLYGSSFTRESARSFQQQRLDEYISSLSADMERSIANRSVTSITGVSDPASVAEQRILIDQLRQARATGRVVLEFTPASEGIAAVPSVALEDGDIFKVPSTPDTVSVVGAVYGQNVFLYNSSRRLGDYIALAGKPNRIADRKHAFIIRADGSIYSRQRAQGTLSNNFDTAKINPGDAIVVPEKIVKPSVLREISEYSQILSSFGLAAAAIELIR